ncbi:MAG: hypothetical protein ABI699_10665 [Caldimonas sp.]
MNATTTTAQPHPILTLLAGDRDVLFAGRLHELAGPVCMNDEMAFTKLAGCPPRTLAYRSVAGAQLATKPSVLSKGR